MSGGVLLAAQDNSVWPADQPYIRPLMLLGFLTSCCMLSTFIGRRIPTLKSLASASLVKILVLVVLVDSFIFVFTSTLLIFGIGTSLNDAACSLGIWWCIFLYATSKIAIYLFLMERVHLVFTNVSVSHHSVSRFKSPWYRVSCVFVLLWLTVAVCMIVGRIAFRREEDNACVIGLKLYATAPMLTVDVIVNLFLTAAFVVPIYRSKFKKARALAINSSFAAFAALVTSFVNIVILAIHKGKQLSWVCLGSCGLDVTLNALIVYCITSGSAKANLEEDRTTATEDLRRASMRSSRRPSFFPTYTPGYAPAYFGNGTGGNADGGVPTLVNLQGPRGSLFHLEEEGDVNFDPARRVSAGRASGVAVTVYSETKVDGDDPVKPGDASTNSEGGGGEEDDEATRLSVPVMRKSIEVQRVGDQRRPSDSSEKLGEKKVGFAEDV